MSRDMRRPSILIRCFCAGTIASAAWTGCSSDDTPPPLAVRAEGCTLNSDCNDPLKCTFARCHAACRETQDCLRGERCIKLPAGNVCQLPDELECTFTSNC